MEIIPLGHAQGQCVYVGEPRTPVRVKDRGLALSGRELVFLELSHRGIRVPSPCVIRRLTALLRQVYSFFIVAVTNCHKLSGLKQHGFISYSSVGQKSSEGLIRVTSVGQQGCVCVWRLA